MPPLLKLHVGGTTPREGWKILNIQPGPNVDFVGDCMELSQFGNHTISEIYLSHVLEHLDYQKEVNRALQEFKRVLVPGGRLMIGVPDLDALCYLLVAPFLSLQDKFFVMRVIYGGQIDAYDYHKSGFTFPFLQAFLEKNGFERIQRVKSFGLFADTTEMIVNGVAVSLNVEAFSPSQTSATIARQGPNS
jgi:predicted SAM-dependent methyltransferase